MIDSNLTGELMGAVEALTEDQRRQVIAFARSLTGNGNVGVSGASMLRFAGTLTDDAANEMIDAIESGCERIDENEW